MPAFRQTKPLGMRRKLRATYMESAYFLYLAFNVCFNSQKYVYQHACVYLMHILNLYVFATSFFVVFYDRVVLCFSRTPFPDMRPEI